MIPDFSVSEKGGLHNLWQNMLFSRQLRKVAKIEQTDENRRGKEISGSASLAAWRESAP